MAGIFASKSDVNKEDILKTDLIKEIKNALSLFPDGQKLNTNTAYTVF